MKRRMMLLVGPMDGVVLRTIISGPEIQQSLARARAYYREFAEAQGNVTDTPICIDAWVAVDAGGFLVYELRTERGAFTCRETDVFQLINGEAEF